VTITEARMVFPWLSERDILDIFEALDGRGLMIAPQQLTDADVNRGWGREPEAKPTPGTQLFRNFWNSTVADYVRDIKTV